MPLAIGSATCPSSPNRPPPSHSSSAMVLTDQNGRVLFSSPASPGSCADITHARQLGLVKLLADGPVVEILADAGYQGLGAQTGGRVVTPPHRKFKWTVRVPSGSACRRVPKRRASRLCWLVGVRRRPLDVVCGGSLCGSRGEPHRERQCGCAVPLGDPGIPHSGRGVGLRKATSCPVTRGRG